MKDKIDELFTNVDDLTDETLRVDAGVIITDEGFPIFHIQYNRPVTDFGMTRDQLARTIRRMTHSLWEMDNWTRRRR